MTLSHGFREIGRLGGSTIVSTYGRCPAVVRQVREEEIQGSTQAEREAHFSGRVADWLAVDDILTPLFAAPRLPGGHRLLVSRLQRGRSLATVRRATARPMSPAEIADLLLPAAQLLESLHAAGPGHGRLRPETLILRAVRRKSHAPYVLVDFDCGGRSPQLGRSSAFFHPRQGSAIERDVYGLSAIAFHLSRMGPPPGRPAHEVLAEGRVPEGRWKAFLSTVLSPQGAPADVAEWQRELTRVSRPCVAPW